MKMFKSTFLLFLLQCFFAFANAQSKYPSILWEIKKTANSKPSYLFGTYHVSSKGVFKLGDSIFVALKNVDIVAKEVNANTWQKDRHEYEKMYDAFIGYRGENRERIFNENTLKKTNTIEKLAQFISNSFDDANYFLYRNNAQNDGFEEEMYLDKFISSAGYKYGKDIKGLENYMESSILGIEGEKDQADLEKVERKKLPLGMTYREVNDKIYDGYLNNNLDAMDSFSIYQFESEAFANKFLIQRNYNQADSIDFYINTGKTIFAAVGSAHLPGKQGVIEILRSKGYELRPVQLVYKDNETLEAIKKKKVDIPFSTQHIEDVITFSGPGTFFPYYESDILKTYGYVDMANGAFYYVSRLLNSSTYFTKDDKRIAASLDSLLYSNIKGDIVEKKQLEFKGYTCIDVKTKVKNKDIERYRFMITAYEIIKFQVGGKNDYASISKVDSFFNSITLNQEKKLGLKKSFQFGGDYSFHTWVSNNEGFFRSKERYTNFDIKNDQLNSCIKIVLQNGTKVNDSLIMHMVRESMASSEMFPREFINNQKNVPLVFNESNNLSLSNDKKIMYKVIFNYPYLYFLSSLHKIKPSEDFINGFSLKKYANETEYVFQDSAKGFEVKIPFQLKFDARWKNQLDRIKKKYDDNKNPNENKNLFFYGSLFGNNNISDQIIFEDKANMEKLSVSYNVFDDEIYYSNPSAFWNNYMKKYLNNGKGNSESGGEESVRMISTIGGTNTSNFVSNTSLTEIKYDTLNNKVQKLSFIVIDSVSKRKIFHQVVLARNKLYDINFVKHFNELTETQQLFIKSFQPIVNNEPITIFKSTLENILADYKIANKQKRPNVLNRINNLHLGISDFEKVKSIINGIKGKEVEDNILKRKLIDMVVSGIYSDKEWPVISNWLLQLFRSNKEYLTIRNFAAISLIRAEKVSDADSIIKYFYAKPNAFQKRFSKSVYTYFLNIYPKTSVIPKLKLYLRDKEDYRFVWLSDSGYFNLAEKQAAFIFYKKMLEDETQNMQLTQERTEFLFKEKEINETMTSSTGRNNFQQLLNGFDLYYSLQPKDPFFKEAFETILSSKSTDDLTSLLDILLQQKVVDYTMVNKVVEELGNEPSKLYDINKIFYTNKKYDKLAVMYKDKSKIAKSVLLRERQYTKLDSVTYISSQLFLYSKNDSIFVFKYIKNRESNTNIAFVLLDGANTYLDAKPFLEFTTEQISKIEPLETIVAKWMRKYYTSTYFIGRNNFYFNNNAAKSINSDD
jgi:uncharacterized protein YbaP (TraB family)